MIGGLKPYREYRESGVSWLGRIPSHWTLERAKWLFHKMDRPARAQDHVVTCFRDGVVTLRKNRRLRGFTESVKEIGYQGIRRGDLVIHAMDAFAGAVGVSDSDGKGTPVYSVCQPRLGTNPNYYAQVVREMARSQWILALSKGIRERSTDFRFETFGRQVVPVPPEDDQRAIARFLATVDAQCRHLTRTKRKMIALLNEQKQTIIHRAVTRGLDPTVCLKPSGIAWLGDVPKHWETHPMKRLLSRMDYGTSENIGREGRVRVLTMGHIRDGEIVFPERGSLDAVPEGLRVETHDLIFNRTNSPELVGKVGIFRGSPDDDITFASYLVRIRTRPEHSPFWLNYLLNSVGFWSYAKSQALVSLHQANLNSTRYGQMILPVPPRSEQDQIVAWLSAHVAEFRNTAGKCEREIDLVHEYRTRLVADAATGRADVRDLSLSLPAEIVDRGLSVETVAEDETEELLEAAADHE